MSRTFRLEGIFRSEGGSEIVENRIKEILAEQAEAAGDLDKRTLFSQEALARKVGISVFKLNRIANGKQAIGMRLQKAIAKALRRPLEEVFPRADRKARAG